MKTEFLETVKEYFDSWVELFTTPLMKGFSISTIVLIVFSFLVLFYLSKKIQKILENKILIRAGLDKGIARKIGTITKLSILFIGSIIIVQTAGINLSSLGIMAGALGVGIGFGLQNITSNLISGVIILFEKPIKLGDRIDVGGVEGNVYSISFRATTIITNDNISIIVPNSDFIAHKVINWSHNDRNIRFKFPVGVSYKEDPEKVREVLLDVANNNPNVLEQPAPSVLFDGYGESSLDFILAVWTNTHNDKPRILKSELYFEIFKRFRENGIEIPFPQRDIHIKTEIPKI